LRCTRRPYPPILKSITMMGRQVITSQMERSGDDWGFDPGRLERDIAEAGCRTPDRRESAQPHGGTCTRPRNCGFSPISRWRHDLLVIADEIFAELAFPPHRHIPLASLGPDIADRTVTLTSATKAFNFAGLRCAVAQRRRGAAAGGARRVPARPPRGCST